MDRLITQTFKVDDTLTDVTTAKLSDPTGLYGLTRNDLSASTISDGTLADPVVITTTAAHGLSDGQMVHFSDVVGMTNLNGLNYYAKVTGYSATTYALYQEAALTNTIDGTGFIGAATDGTASPLEVSDGTSMTKASTGTYTYTLEDAVEGVAYTAYIEFVYDGDTFHVEYNLPAWVSREDLDIVYSTLRIELADMAGWTRTSGNWSTDESNRLDAVIDAGWRQFIYPPVAPGETVVHRWTFLRPTATFDTVASQYLYDMPVDYASIVGDLIYDEDEDIHRIIEHVNPGVIDRNRAVNDYEGRPYQFAIRPKGVSQATEQVMELMLCPTPDAVYGIVYHYDAKVDIISGTYPYHLGGQMHSETILQSCRDIMAARYNDDPGGREHQLFLERLKASIEADRRSSPKTIGVNNDGQRITHTRHGTEFTVTHGSMP